MSFVTNEVEHLSICLFFPIDFFVYELPGQVLVRLPVLFLWFSLMMLYFLLYLVIFGCVLLIVLKIYLLGFFEV